MTTWKYVGCSLDDLPPNVSKDPSKLNKDQIKQILEDISLVTGLINATTVDAVTALLIEDNILPIKIHPLDKTENSVEKLKRLQQLIKRKLN